MESPLIIALSRQMASRDQVESIANNIANMNTNAFKSERTVFNKYLTPETGAAQVTFPKYVGIHRDTEAGPINATGNTLDIGLRGDGFLVVTTENGPRYTRDGHLSINAQNQIVNSRGLIVQNDADLPIVVPPNTANITISPEGSITADGQEIGKLKLVGFDNLQRLQRAGNGLYTTDAEPRPAEKTEVLQGYLEGANVTPIMEITRMIEASRVYQSSQKVINSEDERIRGAIQRLGKVA
ncbi:MAG: flagellar basal-body rod protein FlgF [Alphaproteobacteria bacterium]